MNVLFVTMQYGRAYRQGTERYIDLLTDALRSRGHGVSHLAGDPLGPPRPLGGTDEAAPEIHTCPTSGWMAVQGLSPRRLAGWLKAHRPDIVHLNHPGHIGVGIIAACRRLGVPVVVTVHDYWWTCPKSTLLRPDGTVCDGTPGWSECIRCIAAEHHRPVVRKMARLPIVFSPLTVSLFFARAVRRGMRPMDMFHWLRRRPYLTAALDVVDCVIFPSRAIAQQIAPALNHDRWQVMPNGLPASCFRDRPTATAGRREPATLTLGYAGALLPHKAPHLLFEAVRRLGWHRTRVRLAGPPGERPYEAQLRRDAAGLNVEFCGRIEPERMPDFFASLDLVVVPSVWPENFPYAVLEAHAAGVPVLASRIGGLVEQVEDPSLLFEPGSAEGLAACLAAWAQRDEPPALPVVAKADDLAEKIVHIYAQAAARYDQANHLAGGSGGL